MKKVPITKMLSCKLPVLKSVPKGGELSKVQSVIDSLSPTFGGLERHNNQQNSTTENTNLNTSAFSTNKVTSTKLQQNLANQFQLLTMSPDILFLRSVTSDYLFSLQRNMSLGKIRHIWTGNLSESPTKTNSFWHKLISQKHSQNEVPMPAKGHDQEAEISTKSVVLLGMGWAGQPVVKRFHPILPEVCGDRPDTVIDLKELPNQTKTCSKTTNAADQINTLFALTPPSKPEEMPLDITKIENKTNNSAVKTKLLNNSLHNPTKSYNTISNEKIDHSIKSSVSLQKITNDTVKKNTAIKGHFETSIESLNKNSSSSKLVKSALLDSSLLLPKQNNKMKKKTKVCPTKSNKVLKVNKSKLTKKKKNKVKGFGTNKTYSLNNAILLNQSAGSRSLQKSNILMEKRQFKTYSPTSNKAKVSLKDNIKEQMSVEKITKGKHRKNESKQNLAEKLMEDCKCPTTSEIKIKGETKICGEAKGAEEKKEQKKWKPKMCKITRKIKHKQKTIVCSPIEKFGKSKRKRQLPKCVKPEKKVAPRVKVCPPVIEVLTEKEQKKKCVKAVEEVKVRKVTKVCKPVIIHVKEAAEMKVVVEKKVCAEKKIKKVVSRHTTVCIPQNDKPKMSKH